MVMPNNSGSEGSSGSDRDGGRGKELMKTIYNGVGVKIEDNAEWVTRSQTININYPRGAQGDQKTKIYLCVFEHVHRKAGKVEGK